MPLLSAGTEPDEHVRFAVRGDVRKTEPSEIRCERRFVDSSQTVLKMFPHCPSAITNPLANDVRRCFQS